MNEIDSKNNDAAAIELLAALDDNEPAITAAIDQAISEHKANPDSPPPTLASIAAQLDQQPERETA